MKNKYGFTLIELLIVIAICAILLSIVGGGACGFVGGCVPNYSDGDRAGVVTKFSHKGVMFTSYEGELLLGGASVDSNGQTIANAWPFSVEDEDVAKEVKAALSSGKRVSLHYRQYLLKPVKISTEYVVTKVEYPNQGK